MWYLKVIIIILLIFPASVYGQGNCEWTEVTGEATGDTLTVEELGRLALNRARLSATEQVAGVYVYGSDLVEKSELVVSFITTMTEGYIIKENILRWESKFHTSSNDKPPIPFYKVYAKYCVSKESGKRDPFFTVSLEMNRGQFIQGEEISLKINAGKGAYITIFHLSQREGLSISLPNQFQERQYIEEGGEFIFPREGFKLKARISPGSKKDLEYFMVVATREQFDFKGQLGKTTDISLPSFYKTLLSIPANQRAIAMVGYEVTEK